MPSIPLSDPAVRARRHAMAAELRAIDISVTIAALCIVILRFWARLKSVAGIGWDDWLIVVATVVTFINMALNLLMVENGLGLQITEVEISELIMIGKSVYADELVYVINLALIKISILIMYCRIFALPGFRIAAWILSIITTIWSFMFIFICIFQCTPIARAWNPTIPGRCLYLRGIFIGNAVPNILTDAMILMMPLYHVWKLHLRFIQRITLMGIFLLGCFVIFASIYRFATILKLDQNNLSYTIKTPTTWSHIEVCTAIISACLPTMRPLLTSFLIKIGVDSSKHRSSNHKESWATTGGWRPGFNRTIDLISDSRKPTSRSEFEELGDEVDQWSAQRTDKDECKGDQVPLQVIKVATSIE